MTMLRAGFDATRYAEGNRVRELVSSGAVCRRGCARFGHLNFGEAFDTETSQGPQSHVSQLEVECIIWQVRQDIFILCQLLALNDLISVRVLS